MIIKIIPEKSDIGITAVEHHNVKEFFILGNKTDKDGDTVDFHDWKGGTVNLLTGILYQVDCLKDERDGRNKPSVSPTQVIRDQIKLDPPTISDDDREEVIDNIINLKPEVKEEAKEEVKEEVKEGSDA